MPLSQVEPEHGRAAFVGVDLAWKSERNPTGLAVLVGDRHGAQLERVSDPIPSLHQVIATIRASVRSTTVVGVDAPLIIANQDSQRACERAVGRSNTRELEDDRGVADVEVQARVR